jgi:hypothetical protein
MAGGTIYRVHFPDGTATPHSVTGEVVGGTELFPTWLVTRIATAEPESFTEDGALIFFEVWVEPTTSAEPEEIGT